MASKTTILVRGKAWMEKNTWKKQIGSLARLRCYLYAVNGFWNDLKHSHMICFGNDWKKRGKVIRINWRKWLRWIGESDWEHWQVKEWLLPPRKQPFLVLFPACWFGNQLSDFIEKTWSQKEIPCWKFKEIIELSFVKYDNTNVCMIEIEANRVNP